MALPALLWGEGGTKGKLGGDGSRPQVQNRPLGVRSRQVGQDALGLLRGIPHRPYGLGHGSVVEGAVSEVPFVMGII